MKKLIFLITFLFSVNAFACPAVRGVPDFNCDGELNIVALGDSLVYGTGDTA